jgi:hypothetical protein
VVTKRLLWLAVAIAALPLAGCAAAPRTRPVKGADVDAGAGSTEAVRRQLQGTWELVALESVPPSGGSRVPIRAAGTLTYDEFGNMTIDAHTTDRAAPVAALEQNMLAFKGRAVIDATRSELKLMDVTGNVNPDEVLSVDRRRKYEFAAGTLKLSSIDEQGRVTAVSTWRHRQ